MRLICPNCGAQYEVADDAIPSAGRDVQCSNCSHGWFQYPPDHESRAERDTLAGTAGPAEVVVPTDAQVEQAVQAATAHATDSITSVAHDGDVSGAHPHDTGPTDIPNDDLVPVQATDTEDAGDEDDQADAVASELPPLPDRSIDDSLLAVLREEAEREAAQRRAEMSRPIETQTELGIESAVAAVAAPAIAAAAAVKRPGPGDAYAHLSSDADDDPSIPEASVRPAARRDLLPDVEEISSTLRSSGSVRDDDDNPMPELPSIRQSGGFRSGFLLSILLAVMLVLVYVAAPRLAEQFPAAKGALESYVTAVDALRGWLRSVVARLTGMLESQE